MPTLATAQRTLPATLPTLSAQAPAWQHTQAQNVTPQTIQAVQKHIADLHAPQLQTRNAMLGALTPTHRAVLSQIAGELAVSANPDAVAAARQLDATLAPRWA